MYQEEDTLKKNVGNLDAYLRLVTGFSMFGYGIMKRSKLSIILGSIKIAEGITGWCPILAIMGISTISENAQAKKYKLINNKLINK